MAGQCSPVCTLWWVCVHHCVSIPICLISSSANRHLGGLHSFSVWVICCQHWQTRIPPSASTAPTSMESEYFSRKNTPMLTPHRFIITPQVMQLNDCTDSASYYVHIMAVKVKDYLKRGVCRVYAKSSPCYTRDLCRVYFWFGLDFWDRVSL